MAGAPARSWWRALCACFTPRDEALAALVAVIERQAARQEALLERQAALAAAASERQAALLAQLVARLPDDDGTTVLSDAQYEERARAFVSTQLLRRCGLEVVAGVDVTRASLKGLQWDFRAPVTIAGTAAHPNAEAGVFAVFPSKPSYERPPRVAARKVTPTRFSDADAEPLAHYLALFEFTTAPRWASRYKDGRGGGARTMLWRLEERLAISLERARSETSFDAAAGILDLVAVVGVVAPTTCTDSVSAQMAKVGAPPNLLALMRAGRFVALAMPTGADAARGGALGGGTPRASAGGSAPRSGGGGTSADGGA